MVSLGGAEAVGTFKQLEIVMCQWRRTEQCPNEQGPFISIATRTSFKAVDLS